MSAAQHTPESGEWMVQHRFQVWDYNHEKGPYRVLFDCTPRPETGAFARPDGHPSEEEADEIVRLAASAPDLLAALQAVAVKLGSRPYGTGSYLPKPIRDQVFAAIERATGAAS